MIGEVTDDLEHYVSTTGEVGLDFTTKFGMFEYAFMYCTNVIAAGADYPAEQVIKGLEFWIEGHKNKFSKSLDEFDIERLSRRNCHDLCEWRSMHDAGRGILVHLSDLGILDREKPFPARRRTRLKFKVTVDDASNVNYHVVLIRNNRLLEVNAEVASFTELNQRL